MTEEEWSEQWAEIAAAAVWLLISLEEDEENAVTGIHSDRTCGAMERLWKACEFHAGNQAHTQGHDAEA